MSILNMVDSNNIEIRAAHSAEVTRLGQLLRDSFITSMSPIVPDAANVAFANLKEPERFAQSCWQDFQVLAIQNGIKGMLFVVEDKIESLHLDPAQKRRGYGSLLLRKGESIILYEGYSIAKLDVLIANQSAIAFYQSQGWQIDSEFIGLEVGDVQVPMYEMRKKLS
jgi:ribosomal protein S18 acetylase RimI-like enzyme